MKYTLSHDGTNLDLDLHEVCTLLNDGFIKLGKLNEDTTFCHICSPFGWEDINIILVCLAGLSNEEA